MSHEENNNRKGRNPFATVASYTPLAAASIYGAGLVYRDLTSNGPAPKPPSRTTLNKAAASIGEAKIAAAGVINTSKSNFRSKLLTSLAGAGYNNETIHRFLIAHALAVSDSGSSLSKQNMHNSLYTAMNLMNQALGTRDKSKFSMAVYNLLMDKRHMPDNVADLFWRKWQMLDSTFDTRMIYRSSPFLSRSPSAVLSGVSPTQIGVRVPTHDLNLGFFAPSAERDLPLGMTRSALTDANEINRINKLMFGSASPGMNLAYNVITRDKRKYYEVSARFGRNNFRFALSPDGRSILTQNSFTPIILGTVMGPGGQYSIWQQVGSALSQMKGASPISRRGIYNTAMQRFASVGLYEGTKLSPGQRLIQAMASNSVIDVAALSETGYSLSAMEAFLKANPGLEAQSPSGLVKGKFLNAETFALTNPNNKGSTSYNLRELYKDTQNFDRSRRLFQIVRDLSYTPTQSSKKTWARKTPQGGYDPKAVGAIRFGPSGALQRFRPVNAGSVYDDLLVSRFGYITPHALTLHVLGDTNERLMSRWGARDGQALVTKAYNEMLTTTKTVPYDISGIGGAFANVGLSKKQQQLFAQGKLTAEEYVNALRHKLKGGPIQLQRGQILGMGIGTESGSAVKALDVAYGKESILDVQLSTEGNIRFLVQQEYGAAEGKKIFGQIKATLASITGREREQIVREALGSEMASKNARFIRDLDIITGTSSIEKDVFALNEQMVSALRYVSGSLAERLGKQEAGIARKVAGVNRRNIKALLRAGDINQLMQSRSLNEVARIGSSYRANMEALTNLVSGYIHSPSEYGPPNRLYSRDIARGFVNRVSQILSGGDEKLIDKELKKLFGSAPVPRRRALRDIRRVAILAAKDKMLATESFRAIGSNIAVHKDQKRVIKQMLSDANRNPVAVQPSLQLQRLQQFLSRDPGHLYDVANVAKRTGKEMSDVVLKYANWLGLGSHELSGLIFGGAVAVSKNREALLSRISSEVSPEASALASCGIALGFHGTYTGDLPHLAQGRVGSVEMRNIDMLLAKNINVGGLNLTEGILKDIYGSVASSSQISNLMASSKMYWSMRGKVTPGAGDSVVDLYDQTLSSITSSEWFKGEGAWVRLPKEMHGVLEKEGLSTTWFVPGERMATEMTIKDDLHAIIEENTFARRSGGELQPKSLRSFIEDSFEALSPMGRNAGEPLEDRLKDIIGGASRFYAEMRRGVVTGKMGPGSSYAQVMSLGAITPGSGWSMHPQRMAALGLGTYEGGVFTPYLRESSDNVAYMSEKLARRLIGEMGENIPKGMDTEAFLRGETTWGGIAGRMPGVYMESIQPTNWAVVRGRTSSESEFIMLAQRVAQVMVDGKTVEKIVGLDPGMGADFDGDRVFGKLFSDQSAFEMFKGMSKAQWDEYNTNYVLGQSIQDELSKRMKAGMIERFKGTEEGLPWFEKMVRQIKRLFIGKDVGPISKALEELRYSMFLGDMPETQRELFFRMFSAAEEAATLKAKHLPDPVSLANMLRDSLYGESGGTRMNPQAFLDTFSDIFGLDKSVGQGFTVGYGGQERTVKMTGDDINAFVSTVNKYANSDAKKVFAAFRTKREMSVGDLSVAVRTAFDEGKSAEAVIANIFDKHTKGGMVGFVEEQLTKLNTLTKDVAERLGPSSKRLYGIALAGLAATAMIQSFTGGNEYASEPMEGSEGTDPRLLDLIRQGNLLQQGANDVPPEELTGPGSPPSPQGQIHQPVARITSKSSSVRITGAGDGDRASLDRATLQFRDRLPGSRVRATIVDQRRPLYPSEMERY